MLMIEREMDIPKCDKEIFLVDYFKQCVQDNIALNEIPVRFAITKSDSKGYHCELGVLTNMEDYPFDHCKSIFEYSQREYENTENFNTVLLVPTGIGAEIGGHAGDAGPVARLMASSCDTLITHPNVVNASDINELPENGLYVEGSVISNLLMGTIGLQKTRSNRVMLVIDKHQEELIASATINAASAARASLGLKLPKVIELDPPIKMRARFSTSGCAVGRVEGLRMLCDTLSKHKNEYDAIALASVIDVPYEFHTEYFEKKGSMINPWGGVEAMLTHAITMLFGIPAAHSPMFENIDIANLEVGVVDPRMSAEAISACFLHCILKGLHSSPRIISDPATFGKSGVISASDVSCLVIPYGCVGLPTLAAMYQGIPVIAVRENRNRMKNDLKDLPFASDKLFIVDNYLEATGIISALKAGVSIESIRRPLAYTKVITELVEVKPDDIKKTSTEEVTNQT